MTSRRHRGHRFVMACALVGAAVANTVAIEGVNSAESDFPDVRLFADAAGIQLAEAERRLDLQQDVGRLREYLEEGSSATFAGMWVEHVPEFRVHVAQTETSAGATSKLASIAPQLATSLVVSSADYTYAQLSRDLLSIRSLEPIVPFDAAVNEQLNRVDIWVSDYRTYESFLDTHGVRVPRTFVVTPVEELSKPAAAIYGGLRIDDSSPDDADCTSGYSVRHVSQAVGITVAGHCANTGMNYGGTTLPYHTGVYSGSHDEQWHTTPGFTPTNRIRYHEDGNTRPITSRRIRSTQSIGDPVCKFGVTTGYDCGNVINRSFAPSWVPNATPTFIVAEQLGVDMCSPEDSGGPVFFQNAAWGTISGYTGSGSQAGKQVVYVAIDYVEAGLNVSILTQ